MSVPKKHHYLPEFFTHRWADAHGNLVAYRRPHKELEVKSKHPAATGFKFELYANTTKTDPLERQALEMVFMQKVDSHAAEALKYLEERRAKPPETKLQSAWSRFLMSLLYRSPERVKYLTEQVRRYEESDLTPQLKAQYAERRGPDDPETFDEWFKATGPATPDLVTRLLRMLIDSENIGSVLNAMHWRVHEADGKFGFVTGDVPVLMSNGLGTPRG